MMAEQQTISMPEGANAVVFKDEDGEGVRYGPVWFRVGDWAEVDSPYSGTMVPAFTDGVMFDGSDAPGWMTKPQARKMAKHFDLPFMEI